MDKISYVRVTDKKWHYVVKVGRKSVGKIFKDQEDKWYYLPTGQKEPEQKFHKFYELQEFLEA